MGKRKEKGFVSKELLLCKEKLKHKFLTLIHYQAIFKDYLSILPTTVLTLPLMNLK